MPSTLCFTVTPYFTNSQLFVSVRLKCLLLCKAIPGSPKQNSSFVFFLYLLNTCLYLFEYICHCILAIYLCVTIVMLQWGGPSQGVPLPHLGSPLTSRDEFKHRTTCIGEMRWQVYLWNTHEHKAASRHLASRNAAHIQKIKLVLSLLVSEFVLYTWAKATSGYLTSLSMPTIRVRGLYTSACF